MSGRGEDPGNPADSQRHLRFLSACLDLARMSEGDTSPNPMVGAILVKADRILGQGYHRRAGDPHAEVEALKSAGAEARGSTLYVNLEPCVHHGRTPPCADALIEAGVAEVIACMIDPDPRVNGKGFRRLSQAGVRVSYGLLREPAQLLNEKFVKFVTTGLPFVTLKAAMTLDGKIAPARGSSKWITCEDARREAHRLRYAHDGILVGVGTVLADNPHLTARWAAGKPLARGILDSHLRTPPDSRALANDDGGSTLVYTLRDPPAAKRRALEKRPGVEVMPLPSSTPRVDFSRVLEDMGKRRIMSVLVEGGGQVLGSALESSMADRLALFIAPRILGQAGVQVFEGLTARELGEAIPVMEWSTRKIGSDILIEGRLSSPPAGNASECLPD
jgi:diaminohydroxyphosphoribosylaminopyrimidine deaminase / 5-amino-6-(5-phosphoribosylamino)uracil reductase